MTKEPNRREALLGSAAVVAGGFWARPRARPSPSRRRPLEPKLPGDPGPGPNCGWTDFCSVSTPARFAGKTCRSSMKSPSRPRPATRRIEPWVEELERHASSGGSLEDLGKQLRDAGISVESAIGFFDWIVDDPDRRRKGLETARRSMDLVRRVGGKRLAAPPVGATEQPLADLSRAAERYRALLEVGDQIGVVPEVEVWGFSRTLGRLGEAACVAIDAGHPKACILPDVYHLYRGGSDFAGIKLLGAAAIHVFHFNDYPADPPRGPADRRRPSLSRRRCGSAAHPVARPVVGRLPCDPVSGAVQPKTMVPGPSGRCKNRHREDAGVVQMKCSLECPSPRR